MPVWPSKGSVALKDDIIIVNLSENPTKYYLELFQEDELEVATKEEVYKINLELDSPNYYYDMEVITKTDSGLIMKSNNVDPQISFTMDQKLNNDSFEYILIQFESNVDGVMQLFLAQQNESYGKFNGTIAVKKGINSIYCRKQVLMENVSSVRIDPPNNSSVILNNIEFIK
ncbi:hypothetical protein D3C74_223050 [compost metagenome]